MTIAQKAYGSFRNLRVMLVLLFVVVTVIFSILGEDVRMALAPTCDTLPSRPEAMTEDHWEKLVVLFERDLLHCPTVPEGIDGFADRLYWGSDGIASVLFFEAEDMTGIGVAAYQVGENPALTFSDRPPARYQVPSALLRRNMAPDDASYFWLLAGAPTASTADVTLEIRGPAKPQAGVGGRDFYDDLIRVWRMIRGEPANTATEVVEVRFSVSSDRWLTVPMRWINPQLMPDDPRNPDNPFLEQPVGEPTLFQTAWGPLGASLTVAGVTTGTASSLALIPLESAVAAPAVGRPPANQNGSAASEEELDTAAADAPEQRPAGSVTTGPVTEGEPVRPEDFTIWTSPRAPNALAIFAFKPVPPHVPFEAHFWHGNETEGPPDAVFGPFTFYVDAGDP